MVLGCYLCFFGVFSPVLAKTESPVFGVIDWFPFGWEEAGKSYGLVVDVAAAIDNAIGMKSQKVVSPVPRVLRAIENGEFDFTITYRDSAMLGAVDYLADLGCLRSAVVSFKSAQVTSLEQLNGLRVAYPGGGYFVKRFLPDLDIKGLAVSHTEMMFRMASRRRLDAFIINDAVWYGYKNDLNPQFKVSAELWPLLADPLYVETLPFSVSVSKDSKYQVEAEKIRQLMHSRAFRETLLEIYARYQLPEALSCLPDGAATE